MVEPRLCFVLLALVAAGCTPAFDPPDRAHITCGAQAECPSPLECVQGRCRRAGEPCVEGSSGALVLSPDGARCPLSPGADGICVTGLCQASRCGDALLAPAFGEQCDDGAESATCNADCTPASCGDGKLNAAAGEACDDRGDSARCNADCTLARCGDAKANLAAGELCDDGAQTQGCNPDCTRARCGDGYVNSAAGEVCDEGADSPACNGDCTPSRCGDAKVNLAAGELCDDGAESAACNLDCTPSRCGDGRINRTAGEVCDDAGDSPWCDGDCTLAHCGDGEINLAAGELCDDGAESAACNGDCTLARCGDAKLNRLAGELCDDGADTPACDGDCTPARCGDARVNLAAGERCDTGEESAACNLDCSVARCGDAKLNRAAGEACDDGAESASCNADCTAARCGDGKLNALSGEACDLGGGNSRDPDATCRPDCRLATCGDGVLDPARGEVCDGADLGGADCASQGHHPGTLACGPTCRFALAGCGGRCGDGVRDAFFEACDGDDLGPASCAALGYYEGSPTCLASCEVSEFGCRRRCGDGVLDLADGEVCDGAAPPGRTCQSEGFYRGPLGCSERCDGPLTQGCEGRCGDGVLDAADGEVCDGAQLGGWSCQSFGYRAGALACRGCRDFDKSLCSDFCGDGVAQAPEEECDGLDQRGDSCASVGGYPAGALGCRPDCTRDFSPCVSRAEWTEEQAPTFANLVAACALPSGDFFMAGSGLLGRFSSGRWRHQYVNDVSLLAVFAGSPDDAWAVGRDDENYAVFFRFDGSGWTRQAAPSGAPPLGYNQIMYALWGTSPSDVWAGGQGLFRFDGTSWTAQSAPAGTIRDLDGTAADDLWAAVVGPANVRSLQHRGPGGWSAVFVASDFSPRSVRAFSAEDVFVAGTRGDGTVAAYRFDGVQWLAMDTAASQGSVNDPKLWGAHGTDLYLNANARLLHFDGNAQHAWAEVTTLPPIGNGDRLLAGAASGPTDGWVGGTSGFLAHLDGSAWALAYPTASKLSAVWGSADDHVFAVGGSSRVWRHDGLSWQTLSANAPGLTGVWGRGPADVWAVGAGGAIRHFSGDPAAGFAPVASPVSADLAAISGHGDTVFASGSAGTLLSLGADGAWTKMAVPAWAANKRLLAVRVNPDGSAYAAGDTDTLLRYSGGAWSCLRCGADNTQLFSSLWGTSADALFVGGGLLSTGPAVWRAGTATWQLSATENQGYFGSTSALWGRSPSDVFASFDYTDGELALFKLIHFDGASWSEVARPSFPLLTVYGMWSSGPADLVTVGNLGQIARQRPPGWKNVGPTGAVALQAAWGPGDGSLIAVGAGGAVHRLSGSTWAREATLPSLATLRSVWGLGAADVFAVGDGTAAHFDGTSWSESAVAARLRAVSGAGALSPLIAVGEGGAALRRAGGSWTPEVLPTTANLNAVKVFGPDDAVAVGEGGAMLRLSSSGWRVVDSGTSADLNAVWGSLGSDVVAVGDGGVALRCDRSRCASERTGTGADLLAVLGAGPGSLFAAGAGGVALHHDGTSWSPMRTGASEALTGLASGGGTLVYAVGAQGAALSWSGALPTPYGGLCGAPRVAYCGARLAGSTVGAPSRALSFGCAGASSTATPKVVYVLDTPLAGPVEVELAAADDELGLTVLGADAYGGCAPQTRCLATAQRTGPGLVTLTFTAEARKRYFLVVDQPDAPSAYTLTASCPKP